MSRLRPLVVYRRDGSWRGLCGQGVIFTLDLADGAQTQVMAYNPFAVIDGGATG